MTTEIQLTDEFNRPINSLNLGELTTSETFKFRVWNNRFDAPGVSALSGLQIDLIYPPKPGISLMAKNNAFQIRCTYSGEFSETRNDSFQNFPITGENFNRLDPNSYNEYEVKINFDLLSSAQREDIEDISMTFSLVPSWENIFNQYDVPKLRKVLSDSSIFKTNENVFLSDSRILKDTTNTLASDCTIA